MKKLLFALALMFCATVFMPNESRASAIASSEAQVLQTMPVPVMEATDPGVGIKVEILDNGDTVVSVYFMYKWVVLIVL